MNITYIIDNMHKDSGVKINEILDKINKESDNHSTRMLNPKGNLEVLTGLFKELQVAVEAVPALRSGLTTGDVIYAISEFELARLSSAINKLRNLIPNHRLDDARPHTSEAFAILEGITQ